MLESTPVADPQAVLRVCEARALEREGIPMILALEDLREDATVRDERALAEGPMFAQLLETYRTALRPDASDEDAGELGTVIAVLAFAHFNG